MEPGNAGVKGPDRPSPCIFSDKRARTARVTAWKLCTRPSSLCAKQCAIHTRARAYKLVTQNRSKVGKKKLFSFLLDRWLKLKVTSHYATSDWEPVGGERIKPKYLAW